MRRFDDNRTGHALDFIAVRRLTSAEVAEADDVLVFLGENDAGRIEKRFGEDMSFEKVAAAQRDRAAVGQRSVPKIHQVRWVGVAEIAVFDHTPPSSRESCRCCFSGRTGC